MIIKPKIRGFVCITTHPVGCDANVRAQIDVVRARPRLHNGPKRALVIGASTGYGLASRIGAAFGSGAATVGVFLEREPAENRPATAGWYNSAAFEKHARAAGLAARSLNVDAFSSAAKEKTIEVLRAIGPVDLVVYSLAAPRRTLASGEAAKSVLKPIGAPYHGKTVDTDKALVTDVTIEPAIPQEIADTVTVMGGDDWEAWMDALAGAKLLADGCKSVAYTYVGPQLTWPIYRDGTIGKAKEDLERAGRAIDDRLRAKGGAAYVSVMKAVVTQASSAIPVVPLYISLLFKIMKTKGIHEGCIEQARRMFEERLYSASAPAVDDHGRLRLDDWEMREDVQAEVDRTWPRLTTENLHQLTDFKGYQEEFLRLFGFGIAGVDYDADVNPVVPFEAVS
ncbi:MAG TPA: enoyl-ACP reductase FabV [Candidatus Krumholzibacteria bacterium]|nr:enoyl-ACP reductase FabV [Candidatus Krumholzibacteria bacterium]